MKREQEIFEQAVALPSHEARDGYLLGACGQDRELRRSVEELLAAFDDAGKLDFLQSGDPAQEAEAVAGDTRIDAGPGTVIGRYKLLEKIGEGGCGVVYMAEQEEPVRRRVALKIIKLGMDTKSVIARFEAERQALAMMDHPNIAKVLDGGATDAGRPFFVMELVRGLKITDYCDQHNLPTRARLDLFIKVCQAIQHAHQKGIIHRDIKPSNILVTLHDGVPVPKVIDFGIAKATTDQRLTDKTLFTALEQFIGTPAYMSPEQAEMSGLDIDTRCDIYSLGVLLYEMLTGQTPFDAKELLASGIDAMRKTIREQEPVRPSTRLSTMREGELTTTARHRQSEALKLINLLRGDVDWIVMKCLEKDRARRYETANGLASDIQRHLDNEAVLARPPSAAYRFQKFVRRNKVMAAAAAAVASVLVLGTAISTWQAIRATEAQHQALDAQQKEAKQHRLTDEALGRAQAQERLSRQRLYAAEMTQAFEALKSDNLGRSRELLAKQQPQGKSGAHASDAEMDLRGWEWRHLWRRTRGDEEFTLAGHSNSVAGALFLNDGRTIVSAASDDTLRFWDVQRRTNTLTIPLLSGGTHSLALSPDGRWLAVAGDPWQLFDTASRQREYTGTNSDDVGGLVFSPDSQQLALAAGPEIRVLEVASRQMLRIIDRSDDERYDASYMGLAFSPDGHGLAYCQKDQTIRLTNFITRSELVMRPARVALSLVALSLVFTHDGRFLISGGQGGLDVWDAATGMLVEHPPGHHDEVTCVTVSPDGRRLASASVDQTVRLWDTASWKELRKLRGHEMGVFSVAFSSDGQQLVSAGQDERLRVWDLRQFPTREEKFVSADNAPLNWPLAHGDRVVLVHGNLPYAPVRTSRPVREALRLHGNQGAVSYLNCITLEESARESTPLSFSSAQVMAFGPDARSVAVGWPDGRIEFWTTQPFRQVRVIAESTNAPMHLAVAASGQRAVSVHRADDTVEIWDPVTGALERRLPAVGNHFGGPNYEFWAHDRIVAGHSLGGGSSPPVIELWFLPEGRRRVFAHPKGGLWSRAISNDGRWLATSGWDGVLRLWDVDREQQIETIAGQLKTYYSLVFSPDDSRLVGGGNDGTITMWDMATRQQVAQWKAHERECAWLRFVGGDETLVSLGDQNFADRHQGNIQLWPAPSLSEIGSPARNP